MIRRFAVFLLILVLPVLGVNGRAAVQARQGTPTSAQPAPGPKQPVYISLFAVLEDHLNMEITNDRLQRTLSVVRALRQDHPAARATCLLLFSGTTSDALQSRDLGDHMLTAVREAARSGLVEAGYDGSQEPTFLTWPRPNFRGAKTGEQRWLARSQAAEWFLTEFKSPVTGEPDPERPGGVKRAAEVFGPLAFVTGVDQEIGGDSEVVHQLRRLRIDAVLQGVPENTGFAARLLHGFGGSAAGVGRAMSPEPTQVPEVFWMDDMLRLSDTSGAPVKVFMATDGPEALKKLLDGLDRSRPHVIRVRLADPRVYLKPGFAGGRYTTPLEWAYDNPKSAHLGADGLAPRETVDAAAAREQAVLTWLAATFFADNPGSRFISIADLKGAARTSVGSPVPFEAVKAAAATFLTQWEATGNYPPIAARAGDEYLSLADMFQLLAASLAQYQRDGRWPQSVTLQRVYGPLEMTDATGPVGEKVKVGDVVASAAALADRLNSQSWKPVPDNVIPTWVTVGQTKVNAAQFLFLMADALAAPGPGRVLTTRINYMFAATADAFPKSRPRQDLGAFWTLKPAHLARLQ